MPSSSVLRLDNVTYSYGTIRVLTDVSLSVSEGELVAVVGKSGCGKSTLLEISGGFLSPDSGAVTFLDAPPRCSDSRFVSLFQHYQRSLLYWRTALGNVEFGVVARRVKHEHPRDEAREFLKKVGLLAAQDRLASRLSGGMQQRVVLARALAAQPDLLLMDEPLSSLDSITQIELQKLFMELWKTEQFGCLLATHNIAEAIALSHRVLVLSSTGRGIVKEFKVPFDHPRDIDAVHVSHEAIELGKEIAQAIREECVCAAL
jgi:NitT/TauT family transport system ATP-binding protein